MRISSRYTCHGDDVSPPLSWSDAPPHTKSFALICSDPDAPMTWCLWAIFDMPATLNHLNEGVGKHARVRGLPQATTDFGHFGYGGPCPRRGTATTHAKSFINFEQPALLGSPPTA